jgi:hypothetical protein
MGLPNDARPMWWGRRIPEAALRSWIAMTEYTTVSITESLCALLRQAHDGLAGRPSTAVGLVDFDHVRHLLEALPLTTAEFGLAVNRLANARHYLESSEPGATRYELGLLLRSLES